MISDFISTIDVSEDDILAQLGKEETAAQKASGTPALHKMSASAFLSMGLELEESQYVQFPFAEHGLLTNLLPRRRLKVFAMETLKGLDGGFVGDWRKCGERQVYRLEELEGFDRHFFEVFRFTRAAYKVGRLGAGRATTPRRSS